MNSPNRQHGMLYLSLFGPFEARLGGTPVEIPGQQARLVLAKLTLEAPRWVSMDSLVELLWPASPPERAVRLVQNLCGQLRRELARLGFEGLHSEKRSYRIVEATSDTREFEDLAVAAQSAGKRHDYRAEAELCERAMALVRGEPMSSLSSEAFQPEAVRLARLVVSARIAYAAALIEIGEPSRGLAAALELLAEHPLSQEVVRVAMTAHYASGDLQAALTTYAAFARRLGEETGLDPDAALCELHAKMLRSELPRSESDSAASRPEPRRASPEAPRELPAPPPHFVGRDDLASEIADLLLGRGAGSGAVVALNGAGGIGKSALALHVAHRVAASFSDGQLYVNLQGTGSGTGPVAPVQVLARLMRSLGAKFPTGADRDEAAARFRSATAGRRLLIMLDDATSAEQVLPLLPGGGECGLLITSRHPMAALDAAVNFEVGALDAVQAEQLLRASMHRVRGVSDHDMRRLAAFCGGHPLALCVLAARLRSSGGIDAASVLESLSDEDRRLDELDDGVRRVESVLSTSIRDLEATGEGSGAAAIFRLLGLHSGADFSTDAAAALDGTEHSQAGRRIHLLMRHRLAEPVATERWRMHDVVRLYSRKAADALPEADRAAGVRRLADFYIGSAHNALAAHTPEGSGVLRIVPAETARCGRPFEAPVDAYRWIDEEWENLAALMEALVRRHGQPRLAAMLYSQAYPLFSLINADYQSAIAVSEIAREAVNAQPASWDYYVHGGIADQLFRAGRIDEAAEMLEHAERSALADGFEPFLATVNLARCGIGLQMGDLEFTRASAVKCTELGRRHGRTAIEAWGLLYQAKVHGRLGESREALACSEAAMALGEKLDPFNRSSVLIDLGFRRLAVGEGRTAEAVFTDAADQLTELEATATQEYAMALWGLADVTFEAGDRRRARERWIDSARIAHDIGLIDEAELDRVLAADLPACPESLSVD